MKEISELKFPEDLRYAEDHEWARSQGDTVVVWSENVPSPVAVRFGWHQLAVPNLGNSAGLPASPFRTDRW